MHICFVEILVLIQQYIDGKLPFTEGVKLYNEVGTNSALKKMFATGKDDYSVKKLNEELKKIVAQSQPSTQAPDFNSYTKAIHKPVQIDKLPPHLKEEYFKLSPIIRQMAMLHAKLAEFNTDAERFDAAKTIFNLKTQRRVIFDRIDYFTEHGTDHPMYTVIATEPVKLNDQNEFFKAKNSLNLLRSQRTKLKGKTHRLADFTRVCNEIAVLEDIIKKLKNAI